MKEPAPGPERETEVIRLADIDLAPVIELLSKFGLSVEIIESDAEIPGSYWGEEEAGLIANRLLARTDTPLHSLLHEACHFVCMDGARRAGLDTDAGGGYDEENAVCYLQVLLAGHIGQFGQQHMFRDMDAWGYTFRLGSAQAWFENDSDDALAWLQENGLVDLQQQPRWTLRE